jgi:transcriptional regulator with XRE-family HTH domain
MIPAVNPNMIVLAREASGLTQTELAQKLQLHKAHISRFENGGTNLNQQTLVALAQATGFPPHFFMQHGDIMLVNLAYRKREQVQVKLINRYRYSRTSKLPSLLFPKAFPGSPLKH